MTMRLIAGREQIVSRTISVEKGLHVLVHEGNGRPHATNVYVVPAAGCTPAIMIRPMNKARCGFIQEGEFTLINAREAGDVIATIVGEAQQARTDLRVVALDKGKGADAAPSTTILRAPDLRPRVTSRLIELDAGIHLLRFSRSNRSDDTRVLLGLMSEQAHMTISAALPEVTELAPGQAAVVELSEPTQVLLNLVSVGITASDFSGITIEPLAKLLERLRRGRARGQTAQSAPAAALAPVQAALTGFRPVWPNRPLGLDLALSGYHSGGASTGAAVMTSSWVRAPEDTVLTGMKCSLIGVNRLKWQIIARLTDLAGQMTERTGPLVDFGDHLTPLAAIDLEMVNAQGDRQGLTMFFERQTA